MPKVMVMKKWGLFLFIGFVLAWALGPAGAASNPNNDELIPLIDMGNNTYYGFGGGLYPDGSNQPPAEHAAVGQARGLAVQPLDVDGNPDPAGKIIFLSVGISNAGREFCAAFYQTDCVPFSFVQYGLADPQVNQTSLVWINGARSGQSAEKWDHPSEYNYQFIADNLAAINLSPNQVQVIWLKVMNGDSVNFPTLPDPNADAFVLLARLGNILRTLKIKYPNLQQVFVSSRSYGGFVENLDRDEPIPYETGFAFKWLVEAQIEQMANNTIDPIVGDLNYDTVAPWVDWSVYLWASTTPRSDGLFWERADFGSDGSHVSDQGRAKVSNLMMAYFKYSPFSQPWFLADGVVITPTPAGTTTPTPPPPATATPTPPPPATATPTPPPPATATPTSPPPATATPTPPPPTTSTATPASTARPSRTPSPTPNSLTPTATPRPTRTPHQP